MAKRSFNSSEAARYCHVSPDTIRDWANRGILKSFRTPGGHRRIKREDLIALLKEHNMPVDPELLGHNKRVLVVDDDDVFADAVAKTVSNLDEQAEVQVAHTCFDGGRLVQSFEPDVVLLDLLLPGLDCFEVCQRIKSDPKTKHVVVIGVVDGHGDREAAEIVRLGAAVCLHKPIRSEDLHEALEAALEAVAS